MASQPVANKSLRVKTEPGGVLRFVDDASGTGLGIAFQRTLRIPDDGKPYPLPPGLGAFPVRRVLDYKDRVPASWLKTSGVFLPMYQREAMWISFLSRHWRPSAVKVAAGKINAVSGKPWDQALAKPSARGSGEPLEDYLTVPPQPWLDGFNTGEGTIRQFVAMPLGMGYTVEGQLTGKEEHGGIQIIVYDAKPGRFPDREPPPPKRQYAMPQGMMSVPFGAVPMAPAAAGGPPRGAMGLGAGGQMTQKIYPDPHGIDTWDETVFGRVFVHIVNSALWTEITGEPPPPTPVSAERYTGAGFPWFELYDEGKGDIAPSPELAGVKPISAMDAQHGFVGLDDDASVEVPAGQVVGVPRDVVPDGDW